jgi:hypothetical protein
MLFRILAGLCVVLGCFIVGMLIFPPSSWRPSGPYTLQDHDHAGVMTSRTSGPSTRTISVLFVGGSLTYVNDLPGMVVNIASSDPGNTTRLNVKAITASNATLDQMRTASNAVAYARSNHVDYVILQPHSGWYQTDQGYDASVQELTNWKEALQGAGAMPVLFEDWGDENGSSVFTDPHDATDAQQDWTLSNAATYRLAQDLQLRVIPIGDAFHKALETPGAPEVYQGDHHHPSPAGSYLAALVCYHWLTARPVAAATYRPAGISQADAAVLAGIEQQTDVGAP